MARPVVAIVGRPNVGKSTLFNRLVGRRDAIVEDEPGVTRDRHYGEAHVLGRELLVIDTGGFDPVATEGMLRAMREQAEIAIAEADAIVALYDGRDGLLPADREIARLLARTDKPVVHGVNKIDGPRHEALGAEFWELGVERLFTVSAQHGPGVLDLVEALLEALPEEAFPEDEEEADPAVTRVAVVGKPNAGKSTLVNRLLGEERLLVSDVPGTTRDSIDTAFVLPPDPQAVARAEEALEAALREAAAEALAAAAEPAEADPWDGAAPADDEDDGVVSRWVVGQARGGGDDGDDDGAPEPGDEGWDAALGGEASGDVDVEDPRWHAPADEVGAARAVEEARTALEAARAPRRYVLIDTAGIRRRKWIKSQVERVSIIKAFKAIDRAQVCLYLVDATAGVTDQDAKLASMVADKGRACVVLVNKWDVVPDKDTHTAGAFVKGLRHHLPFLDWAPVVFVSALTGQRCHRIMGEVDRARESWRRRVPTSAFNRFLADLVRRQPPPVHRGRRPRVFYGAQVATGPPTFLVWVSDRQAISESWRRFLLNRIREAWGFEGTPVRLVLRARGAKRAGRR